MPRTGNATLVYALMLVPVLAAGSRADVLTSDQEKCQWAAASFVGKLLFEKAKCVAKCDRNVLAGAGSPADCVPPYGGATAACILGAETKVRTKTPKRCDVTSGECPFCYGKSDCIAETEALIGDAGGLIASLLSLVLCDDAGSGDGLSPAEAKCRESAALELGRFARAKEKCLIRCRRAEAAGSIAEGSCDAGAVSDAAAQACIAAAIDKAGTRIAAKCPDSPECLGSASALIGDAGAAVDSLDTILFCGLEETQAAATDLLAEIDAELDADATDRCMVEAAAPPALTINAFAANYRSDLWLDQTFSPKPDYSALLTSGQNRGFTKGEEVAATRQDIADDLSRANVEDIWIYDGDGVTNAGVVIGLAARDGTIHTADLVAALQADTDQPAIAFIGACRGGELVASFKNAGCRTAFGWNKIVQNDAHVLAVKAFWKEVFDNDGTFGAARTKAYEAYATRRTAAKTGFENDKRKLNAGIDALKNETDQVSRDLVTQLRARITAADGAIAEINADLANPPQLVDSTEAGLGDIGTKKLSDVIPPHCCTIPSPGGFCTWVRTNQECTDQGGTVGAAASVCDAGTGACANPPPTPGHCCALPGGDQCAAGPDVSPTSCTTLTGVYYGSATCKPSGTCG